jgi:hypothetical protein
MKPGPSRNVQSLIAASDWASAPSPGASCRKVTTARTLSEHRAEHGYTLDKYRRPVPVKSSKPKAEPKPRTPSRPPRVRAQLQERGPMLMSDVAEALGLVSVSARDFPPEAVFEYVPTPGKVAEPSSAGASRSDGADELREAPDAPGRRYA